jgi:hypothetical protein
LKEANKKHFGGDMMQEASEGRIEREKEREKGGG